MEAATAAVHASGLPWEFIAYGEIDPAACHLLHTRTGCGRPRVMPHPDEAETSAERSRRIKDMAAVNAIPEWVGHGVCNIGDISHADWSEFRGRADILVGGPPCQGYSISGLRGSLSDSRGNLSLHYARAINELGTKWSFTENVPGWLSTHDNAFGCFLGAVVGADTPLAPPQRGRWGSTGMVDGPFGRAAWRVLDAQGFLPQRRKRVFVVSSRADFGGDPARVLFETEAEGRFSLGERWGTGTLFP